MARDVEPRVPPGDGAVLLVFTASSHPISRAIRWLTRSPVSHVFIEYESEGWGGRWAAEATTTGVRKVQAQVARKSVYAEIECLFDPRPGYEAVGALVGKRYDYFGVALLGLVVAAWRWFRVKLRVPHRSALSQFCSEFAARWLMGCKVPRTEHWDPNRAAPGRLYKFALTHPRHFKLRWRRRKGDG